MNADYIKLAKERMARVIPPKGQLVRVDADMPCSAGQVFRTHGTPGFPAGLPENCRNEEPYLIVILEPGVAEVDGHAMHLAAPLHRDTHMAGPYDLLLPRDIFGHRTAISMDAAITVLEDSLDTCLGSLPGEWTDKVLALLDWVEGEGGETPDVDTGIEYLDENDLRFRFKEEMAENLGYLQAPVLAWAEETGIFDASEEAEPGVSGGATEGTLIKFPGYVEERESALAAATEEAARPLQSGTFEAAELDLSIQVSEAEEKGYCAVEVLRDEKNILENAQVLNSPGEEIARITEGISYFRYPDDRAFAIQLPDGRPVSFTAKPPSGQ